LWDSYNLFVRDDHGSRNIQAPPRLVRSRWRRRSRELSRLIGAVLQEQHEEWTYGERRYFSETSMRKLAHILRDHVNVPRPELYLTA
jgi:hypothetical protein